ncbi:polysaccharide biosynthesis tyrosine autokinase [Modestobacter sp. SYSU DS0290]
MDVKQVVQALRAAWVLPLIGLLVGGAAAWGMDTLRTPQYTANMQFFVSSTESGSTSDVFQGSQFSERRVTSYAQLLTGENLAERVVDDLNLSRSGPELSDQLSANAVTDTVLIDVLVTDPSPEDAQRIAESVGRVFPRLVADLETPDASGVSPVKVTVTNAPDLPSAPSTPKTGRDTTLGAVAGLLAGAAVAVTRAGLDRSVRDAEQASSLASAPVIGVVFRDEGLEKRHTIDTAGLSATAEAYRKLRNNLQFLSVDQPPKVIMISSAVPAEGKTTVAVNLALTLAETGRRVTLVEGDLRRPRVTRYLGMVSGAGLTNILAGSAAVDDLAQPYGDGKLRVIAAGPTPPNPSELLSSSQMSQFVAQLREINDFVLIDAPPLLPVADSSGLAVMVDGVVLSVRYGSTRREQLQQARATLDRVGARTLGVVLNIVPPKADISATYGYGTDYGYDSDAGPKHR